MGKSINIHMHINILVCNMASRNVAITEDLYHLLERRKIKGESFTKVIYRLLDENESPSLYFGAWEDLTEKEEEKITGARKKLRESWEHRDLN